MYVAKVKSKLRANLFYIVLFLIALPVNSAIYDDLNQPLTPIAGEPFPRVASVATFGAELLIALGEEPVAVSNFPAGIPSYLPQLENTPKLGARARTNFAALYQAQPDLVIGLARMLAPYHQRFIEIATPIGFDMITLEDSYSATARASYMLGKAAEGEALNQCFSDYLAQLQQKIGDQQLTGLFLTSAGVTPRAYYSHFMAAGLMEKLNITNASGASPYASKTPFSGQIGLEWLAQLDPDILFIYETAKPQFTDSKIWQSLQAVKNNRVYKVNMNWREPEGPISRIWVTMDMAHKAYPDLFEAPTTERVYEVLNERCS